MSMKQYYDLLEIDESHSKDEVKKAFLSKKASLQSNLLSKDSCERQDAMRKLQELTQAYKEIITSLNNKKEEVREQESGSATHDIQVKDNTNDTKQDKQDIEDTSKITHGNKGAVASVDEKVGQKNKDGNIGTNSNSGTVIVSPKPDDVTRIADNVLICPKCQFANNATLKFCGNCGQPLRNNAEYGGGNSGDNGVVTAIVKYKNYIFSVLAILLILVCGIGVFKNYVNTPEKAVEKYLTALSKQDYAAAYGYLFVTEDDFINKDNYIKSAEFVKKNPSAYKDKLVVRLSKGVIDINVVPMVDQSKIEGLTAYQYTLRLKDNSEIKGKLEVVEPISSLDKILNKYKILNNDLVSVQDIEVETNAKFYIDGVLMKNPTATERGTHNYNVSLFYGEHNIKVEVPFCDPYETKLILTPNTKSTVLYYWKSHLKKMFCRTWRSNLKIFSEKL